jgi:hypothetical protein
MALHEQCVGATSEWYTPRYIFAAMAVQFDMDVASPGRDAVPWIPAAHHLTQNSLTTPWSGFVWMNSPERPGAVAQEILRARMWRRFGS